MTVVIGSGASVKRPPREAVEESVSSVLKSGVHSPSLVFVSCSVDYDVDVIRELLRERFPRAALHGSTSCRGVLCGSSAYSAGGYGLGVWAIEDPQGSYGVGAATVSAGAHAAGASAVSRAIEAAGRPGEPPQLIWLTAAPGQEEEVLAGIQEVVGPDVPIAGGSSADNTVSGGWRQFTSAASYCDGVVITAIYSSGSIGFAFQSGYQATENRGFVTKAEGREVMEIDGLGAADVYNRWLSGRLADRLQGGSIFERTALFPLGREVGMFAGRPYYLLGHPAAITPRGGVEIVAGGFGGKTITMMTTTEDALVNRAAEVLAVGMNCNSESSGPIAGALVVFCAGCMLQVRDRIGEIAGQIDRVLSGAPYLGVFTFGEQGCFLGGENRHGNLMISAVIFQGKKVNDGFEQS